MDRKVVGAVNVKRKTWDRDKFEKRAKERLDREAIGGDDEKNSKKRSLLAAAADAPGPENSTRAFLQQRSSELHLEDKLNKRVMVDSSAPSGYWCEVCECSLKDSMAYLSHINGKNHQRLLGFSMRVERSSVDSVKARLSSLTKNQSSNSHHPKKEIEYHDSYKEEKDKSIESQHHEKETTENDSANDETDNVHVNKKLKSSIIGDESGTNVSDEAQNDANEEDEMAAIMGFSSFGGSKVR